MRCFAAIELPREVVALAGSVQRAVIANDDAWAAEKWVSPKNMHLTVAFFADLEDGAVEFLVECLRRAPVTPFELAKPEFRLLPRARAATMAWLRFADESGQARLLAQFLHTAMTECGVIHDVPDRALIPHVTLVRARRPRRMRRETIQAAEKVIEREDVSMSVSSVTVFASTLTTSGPRYRRLASVGIGQR